MDLELKMLSDAVSSEEDLSNLVLPKLNELLPFMRAFVKKEEYKLEESIKENYNKFKEKDYRYFKDLNKSKSNNIDLLIEGNKDKIHSPISFK